MATLVLPKSAATAGAREKGILFHYPRFDNEQGDSFCKGRVTLHKICSCKTLSDAIFKYLRIFASNSKLDWLHGLDIKMI